jgi:4-hydroxybenzoate polyprenyltransferase
MMRVTSTVATPQTLFEGSSQARHIPLVVDVDGTLLKTDLLLEAALQMAARRPFQLWRLFLWLAQGKAALKISLGNIGDPGCATVPLREEILELIRAAQRAGRPVYLASASDRRFIEKLAQRVGGISGIFATEGAVNLAGAAKAERLVREFGEGGFDYVADADVDFPVWRASRRVLALTHGSSFEGRLLNAFPHAEIIGRSRPRPVDYVRALRPHQWAKNALIFLPLIAGHFFEWTYILAATIGFVCFCLAASGAYLINDLLDLPSDRDHPRKCTRPFASGAIPLSHGAVGALLLFVAAISLALVLPHRFAIVLGIYWLGTLAYSTVLKRRMVVDVVTLGGLYTLRVLAGVAAIGSTIYSPWLLMFCLFLFVALAIVKRCSELIARRKEGKDPPMGRGYRFEDLNALLAFGAAAGYGAVFVVALYLSSPEVSALYADPNRLWLVCPVLLYWITRIFVIANRGDLHEDPLVFALTDRISWAAGASVLFVLALAV